MKLFGFHPGACSCRGIPPQVARTQDNLFCIIGTEYGYIHTIAGDLRVWRSYSGARRFLTQYLKDIAQ